MLSFVPWPFYREDCANAITSTALALSGIVRCISYKLFHTLSFSISGKSMNVKLSSIFKHLYASSLLCRWCSERHLLSGVLALFGFPASANCVHIEIMRFKQVYSRLCRSIGSARILLKRKASSSVCATPLTSPFPPDSSASSQSGERIKRKGFISLSERKSKRYKNVGVLRAYFKRASMTFCMGCQ